MISVSKPPFDPQAFFAKVEAGKTRAELRRRQIVFSQGDPADAGFSIRKGQIELKVLSPNGKEAILATPGAGDFFGEGYLTGQPSRMATAAAATECAVMRIEKIGNGRGADSGASFWRGSVEEIESSLVSHFQDLSALLRFLNARLVARDGIAPARDQAGDQSR